MPSDRDSNRIVIAGASSLLGIELKSLLEESRFAHADFRLVDEEVAAGTLTEAGGEATVIQSVEEGSFARARFVFFTGSAEFTRANLNAARQSGAKVIDLSGGAATIPETVAWFPRLDVLRGEELPQNAPQYLVPSAAATASSALALGLAAAGLAALVFVAFQSVSEAGRPGIEELESQTSQLLSFQNVGTPVFDAQVAFTMRDRFGASSRQNLADARERLRAETRLCVARKTKIPALQAVHAPAFYGTTFAAYSELDATADAQKIAQMCQQAGFAITTDEDGPSSVTAAGESIIQLASPEHDPAKAGSYWLWGAADNIRVPAANAVKLAEALA
jgi:aspartate-semialdehyde dehydrogenase